MSALLALALALPVQDAAPASPAAGGAELEKLCAAVGSAANYSFVHVRDEQGGFGGDQGPVTTSGKFKKGLPVRLQQGEADGAEVAYLADGLLIHSAGEGKWNTFDMEGAFSGGGGDRDWIMQMLGLQTILLPHAVLADFASKVDGVTSETEDGKTVYRGKLSATGADEFSGAELLREFASRFGAGNPELAISGTYAVHVVDGKVSEVHFETALSGDFSGREFERTRQTTLRVSSVGETEFEVPDAVLACIEL